MHITYDIMCLNYTKRGVFMVLSAWILLISFGMMFLANGFLIYNNFKNVIETNAKFSIPIADVDRGLIVFQLFSFIIISICIGIIWGQSWAE